MASSVSVAMGQLPRLWPCSAQHIRRASFVKVSRTVCVGYRIHDTLGACRELPKNQSIIGVYDEVVPRIRANFPTALIFTSPDVITGLLAPRPELHFASTLTLTHSHCHITCDQQSSMPAMHRKHA